MLAHIGGTTPICWIGRAAVDCTTHARPDRVWPVLVRAGAFGRRMPDRDLWLSPDHAVFFEDYLIPVKYFINGETVVQVRVERVNYYHIELPHHDLVRSNGLLTESYLRDEEAPIPLHGSGTPHPFMQAAKWEHHSCVPLLVAGSKLDAILKRWAAEACSWNGERSMVAASEL